VVHTFQRDICRGHIFRMRVSFVSQVAEKNKFVTARLMNKYGKVADLKNNTWKSRNDAKPQHLEPEDTKESAAPVTIYPYFARFGYCDKSTNDSELAV